ncbi:hypothetical protein, variant [Saprolegnia diclina VS20]|uniref:Peptidase C51 domain-containing protein n=1 Tax=Saprolegnia diclina (strain VS20) TaxID=1156394 RepID=T0RRN1_SAPDV|nr:hypothetical protein, variant [Saprolegnia diclina VS20]EQC32802.1 hypothetical protein, variant [Saprolegnia diclina VS20]|eukprot:XP_008613488.1 hypothetical protein, variant [Saprolegnia diclina VS20]
MTMLRSLLVLLLTAIAIALEAAQLPAPFGTRLGVTDGGVEVYSCNLPPGEEALDMDPNYVDGVYTGVRWQCVELARRYLYINYGVIFGDVDYAFQIYDLPAFERVTTKAAVAVTKHSNGAATPPSPGSLLIWSAYGEMAETGHVAVVVNVTDTHVDIAEQNVEDTIWPTGRLYSRRLQVQRNATSYEIQKWYGKEHIIGWITVDGASPAAVLDSTTTSSSYGFLLAALIVVAVGGFVAQRQYSRRSDRYAQYDFVKSQ